MAAPGDGPRNSFSPRTFPDWDFWGSDSTRNLLFRVTWCLLFCSGYLRPTSLLPWWDASLGLTRLLPSECVHSPGQSSASPGACAPPKQLLPARVLAAQDPKALAVSALGARLASPGDLWGRRLPPESRAAPPVGHSAWPWLGLPRKRWPDRRGFKGSLRRCGRGAPAPGRVPRKLGGVGLGPQGPGLSALLLRGQSKKLRPRAGQEAVAPKLCLPSLYLTEPLKAPASICLHKGSHAPCTPWPGIQAVRPILRTLWFRDSVCPERPGVGA